MKAYWITDNRFKYIGIIVLLIWILFLVFLYFKADEITKDPCNLCAKRLGKDITCNIPELNSYFVDIIFKQNESTWELENRSSILLPNS
jgi:hypothetical protein